MIRQTYDVYVIVASYHKESIEHYLDENPHLRETMHFFYVAHKPWHYMPTKRWKFIENSMLKPIMNYAYRLWLIDAYLLAKKLHKEFVFDLSHQLTYVGFRFPGYLWKLEIPFVWGPLGGLENTPWRFLPAMGLKGMVYYTGRNMVNTLHKIFLITPRLAFGKANGGVIAATASIAEEIKKWYGVESSVICEIGPPDVQADCISERHDGDVLRLAWSGEHLPGKALPLLLYALEKLPKALNWQLDILGSGPETKKWKTLANELAIDKHCTWHGKLPRDEAVELVHSSHIFIITSMKDLTSTVLLEALSQGVPVICPDHCGFSNVVTDVCGIKIKLDTIEAFVRDLTEAIAYLGNNEERRERLAKGALERIDEYRWEAKAKQLNEVYANVLKKEDKA
jgi:glycosyltransferase involved in cell wall biosynthesis